jgi:hypothetical protein
MIFRATGGQLVKILRSNFNSDTDYYLAIIQISCGKETVQKNTLYKTQQENIDIIDAIINSN